MKIFICISKENIQTTQLGENYEVSLPNGISLSFTKEAIEELYNDMQAIEASKPQTVVLPDELLKRMNKTGLHSNPNLTGNDTIRHY